MSKTVKRKGMAIRAEEKGKERKEEAPSQLASDAHAALMKKIGIGEAEDREWHERHGVPRPAPPAAPSRAARGRPANPFAIGAGFLEYCVRHGWLVREGAGKIAKYYITPEGEAKLPEFGIRV